MIAQCLGNWLCASGLGGAIGWAVSGILNTAWDATIGATVNFVTNYGCIVYGNIASCF